MTLIIPDAYAQVTYVIQRAGDPDPYGVTFGISNENDVDLDLVAGTCVTLFDDHIQGVMTSQQTLIDTIAVNDTTAGGNAGTVTGSVGAAVTPPNVATLVQKRTSRRGRAYRGRNFWPGLVADADVDSLGNIDSGIVANIQDAMNDFLGKLAAEAIPMVILHNEDSPASVPTLVTSLVVQPLIATQRRRLR